MLMEEFEQRTKIYPSEETYRVIEDFYNKFDGDKDHFCKCFLENTDNLALRITEGQKSFLRFPGKKSGLTVSTRLSRWKSCSVTPFCSPA